MPIRIAMLQVYDWKFTSDTSNIVDTSFTKMDKIIRRAESDDM